MAVFCLRWMVNVYRIIFHTKSRGFKSNLELGLICIMFSFLNMYINKQMRTWQVEYISMLLKELV